MSAADLMGAKALAFAGGIVTLLGVVFFFVLAVGAVLLLGGFFYQRLSAQFDER